MEKKPFVNIFVLNWNGKEIAEKCLKKLLCITYPSFSVTLVDNGSVDGSVDYLKDRFKNVQMVHLPANIGFTGATNYAFKVLQKNQSPFICFVSNDVEVEPGFLEPLIETAIGSDKIALINPKIYYAGTDKMLWYDGGYFAPLQGKGVHRGFRSYDRADPAKRTCVTDIITGCVYLLRTEALNRVGGLDERFFNYAEDTDWSLRMGKAGYSCMYEPRSVVWHRESYDIRRNKGTAYQTYYMTRNILLLMNLHGNSLQKSVFALLFIARNIVLASIYYAIRREYPRIEAIAKALYDYWHRRFGKRSVKFSEDSCH